jgi:hypothetical protein
MEKEIKRRNALKAVRWAVGQFASYSVLLIALTFFIDIFDKDQNLLEVASGIWPVSAILLPTAVFLGYYAIKRYHWHNGEDEIEPRVPEPKLPDS